jgi:hypothetical protein
MLPEAKLRSIAAHCPAYESVIAAQGYGISFANLSPTATASCDHCLHWAGGACSVFHSRTDG